MLPRRNLPQCPAYRFEHTACILKHFVVPEAQHSKPLRLEPFRTFSIRLHLMGMLTTVYFNDQFFRQTRKIDDVVTERYLSTKSEAIQLIPTQTRPEMLFRFRLISS